MFMVIMGAKNKSMATSLYDILNDSPSLNITINAGQLKECIDYATRKRIDGNEQKENNRMLTIEEVCQIAQVSRQTVHRWKTAGLIPFVKIGKNVRFRYSDVINLLKTGKEGR